MTYVDAGPDPNYPDRPDHPDFRLLARIAQDLDGDSGRWPHKGADAFEQFLARNNLDKRSLLHLVYARLSRASAVHEERHGTKPTVEETSVWMACYLDAFALGYEAAKARHAPRQPNGDNRRRAAAQPVSSE